MEEAAQGGDARVANETPLANGPEEALEVTAVPHDFIPSATGTV